MIKISHIVHQPLCARVCGSELNDGMIPDGIHERCRDDVTTARYEECDGLGGWLKGGMVQRDTKNKRDAMNMGSGVVYDGALGMI